jgi:hypothetical protein
MLMIFMPLVAGKESCLGCLVHVGGLGIFTLVFASKISCSATNSHF